MELIKGVNIYIDIGDDQYQLIKNEYIYEFNKYYFKNIIKVQQGNNILNINLLDQKYFKVKFNCLGNYIFFYIFNKEKLIYKNIFLIDNQLLEYSYDQNKFYIYKLLMLIKLLRNKLGKDLIFLDNIIFNINNKLNIIEKDICILNNQKLLYYIQYIKNKFHI